MKKPPTSSALLEKKLSDLKPDTRNANKGTARGAQMIKDSLRDYGAWRSILLDKHGQIIAGNKTVEAAGAGGMKDLLVVKSDGTKLVAVQRTDLDLNDPRARQLAIADNRSAEVSLEWDAEMLKALSGDGVDLGPFWTGDELEKLLPTQKELLTDEDEVPPVPVEPKSKLGDLYLLGNHRLLCGDSTKREDVERLMDGQKAYLLATDPPYGEVNRPSGGLRVLDKGDADNLTFDLAKVLDKVLPLCAGSAYIWCGTDQAGTVRRVMVKHKMSTRICVWEKTNPSPMNGQHLWLSSIEWAVFGKKPRAIFNEHCASPLFQGASLREDGHPTPKPVWLIERILKASSTALQIVLDIFGGSGSTLVACEKTGRKCFMMEISPAYCDVIVERWQNATGKKAVLEGA